MLPLSLRSCPLVSFRSMNRLSAHPNARKSLDHTDSSWATVSVVLHHCNWRMAGLSSSLSSQAHSVNVVAGTKEPRVALSNPRQFGRVKLPPTLASASPAHKRAAVLQSELARRTREEASRRDTSVEALAHDLGISAETLRRQLRGEQPMTLERMWAIAIHLGIRFNTTVED